MAIEEEPEAGIPEWVVTFGDIMSLLLTFFIMLVSMSEIKEDQLYQAMVDSLRQRFGHEMATTSLAPGKVKPRNSVLAKLASMGRARRKDTMNGGDKVKAPVGEHHTVEVIRPGQPTRGGLLVFTEGSAVLTDQHKRILQAAAQVIGGKPQKIEIRGHTSTRPLPPEGPYKTHWDLAYARCQVVMEFLVKLGIERKRMRLTAAADNEPKHIGNDPLLLKENPRVEVFMLSQLVGDLEGSGAEKQQRYSEEGAPYRGINPQPKRTCRYTHAARRSYAARLPKPCHNLYLDRCPSKQTSRPKIRPLPKSKPRGASVPYWRG